MKATLFRLRSFILMAVASACPLFAESLEQATPDHATRPNVILIVCDDLNTDLEGYDGHPQSKTPHIRKLMQSGMSFKQAHCTIPICAPSRSSFLTGIYPHTSRNFGFGKWYENEVLNNSRTIFGHFKANGYRVMGTGKLMHHHNRREWSSFENQADYGPFAFDGEEEVAHPAVPSPLRDDFGKIDGSFGPLDDFTGVNFPDGKTYSWKTGPWSGTFPIEFDHTGQRDPTADEKNAQWAVEQLNLLANASTRQPFFMGIGFLRPHTPLIVDKRFFDQYPLDELELPVILQNDVLDTHLTASRGGNDRGRQIYDSLLASYNNREQALKLWLQAYLACVSSVDELIGSIVDAVDASALKDNTIIVVTSDHGWGNGQKDYIYKNALWEESTRVPLIIRAPRVTRPDSESHHPVSLIDLFPTLIDLCGLPDDTRTSNKGALLDGFSLMPFLHDPDSNDWTGPDAALTAVHQWNNFQVAEQSYALRTSDWRYIRYHTGEEELYDKVDDPYEWKNLANSPEYKAILQSMRTRLDLRLGL